MPVGLLPLFVEIANASLWPFVIRSVRFDRLQHVFPYGNPYGNYEKQQIIFTGLISGSKPAWLSGMAGV